MTEKTIKFIERACIIHNNKYDYSKVEYVNATTKVCIICPEHGEFWQRPMAHLLKQGCPKCQKNFKLNTDTFIQKAKEIHGDKYDYSKVEYVDNKKKICIICPEHGEFWQRPDCHLKGQGCVKCSYKTGNRRKLKNVELFIKEAKEVHGDKYDYSKVEYKGKAKKVCIICPEHGEFWQTPNNHVSSRQNCPRCQCSKLEKEIDLWLHNKNIEFIPQKKFEWLKSDQNYLRLDFYLPQYNVGIECQGKQHYKPIDFFGGEEIFKKQQEWDHLKKLLCEKHNIKVLYYTKKEYKNSENITDKRILLKKILENE